MARTPGKGSVNHNTRMFTAKNVDKERSNENVDFCHADIKELYHQLFEEALDRFNAKQKRSDRKIVNYYEKIRNGRQEKLFHEVIFQIGNKNDMNVKSEEGLLAKKILSEYMEQFLNRNPNLHVFSAHLHMDEETPHIHIDFVPFVCNSKRGLDTRVSLKSALAEQGFCGGTRGATEWNQWVEAEKKELSMVMERYGVQWKQLGTHNNHLSVLDFEKQERQKEVIELEQTISGEKSELSGIIFQKNHAKQEVEQIKQEQETTLQEVKELFVTKNLLKEQMESLTENKDRLSADNRKLEQQQKRLQQELEKMVSSKAVMERNIHAYDEEEKWLLPEPGTLISAKIDKKAMPLFAKLKEIVKSLTIKCVQLMEQVKKLSEKTTMQEKQISRLTEKLAEQKDTFECLQEISVDFGRMECLMGRKKVREAVEQAKELERTETVFKCPKKAFDMSR